MNDPIWKHVEKWKRTGSIERIEKTTAKTKWKHNQKNFKREREKKGNGIIGRPNDKLNKQGDIKPTTTNEERGQKGKKERMENKENIETGILKNTGIRKHNEKGWKKESWTERWLNRRTEKWKDIETNGQTDKRTKGQKDKGTEEKMDKETEGQKEIDTTSTPLNNDRF